MSLPRVALAAVAAFVAYFVLGGLSFVVIPSLKGEFLKYPAVYRPQGGQMSHMPGGMAAMFVSILALAVLYATFYPSGFGFDLVHGARFGAAFGALIGIFTIGAFVVHNYVNLQIGLKLTLQQSAAYLIEWLIVGIVIGLIYRPVTP
jgi:hypothetical protein